MLLEDSGVMQGLPVGVCVVDHKLRVSYWNRCLELWTGVAGEELIGRDITEAFPHLRERMISQRILDVLNGGPPAVFSSLLHGSLFPSILSNGQSRVQHTTVRSLSPSDGEVSTAMLVVQDVTEQTRQAEAYRDVATELKKKTSDLQATLDQNRRMNEELGVRLSEDALVQAMLRVGIEGGPPKVVMRRALAVLIRAVRAPILGIAISDESKATVILGMEDSLPAVDERDPMIQGIAEKLGAREVTVSSCSLDGAQAAVGDGAFVEPVCSVPLELTDARGRFLIFSDQPEDQDEATLRLVTTLCGHLSLVIDNVRLTERLRMLATTDCLTGVLNRAAITETLETELRRVQRYRSPASVVVCDIDRFKQINDSHGHLTGDSVLRHVATVLVEGLRTTDFAGRAGGDEFLLVLPSSGLDEGCRAAQRSCSALAGTEHPCPEDHKISVTASFGVASTEEFGSNVTSVDLIALADRRLYEVKAGGGNDIRPDRGR